MDRLTRKSDNSSMVWFIDWEHESGYVEREPCEMDSHHARLAIAKLAQYEDLEEQKKLLKLHCAVGDTVYRINKGKKEPVIPMRVIGVAVRNENELVIQTKDITDDDHNLYSKNSIGKTVFLTKESAEAALKEMSE